MNWELTLYRLGAGIAGLGAALAVLWLLTRHFISSWKEKRCFSYHGKHPKTALNQFVQKLWSTLYGIRSDVSRHRKELNRATGDLSEQAEGPINPKLLLSTLNAIANANRRLESRLQAAEAQLREQSRQLEEQWIEVRSDPLTGLANRRVFEAELSRRLHEFRKHGVGFALALYDIDHFKQINDHDGHKAGDDILTHVAHAMQLDVPDGVLIARIGGEEFAVLMPHSQIDETLELAERIRIRPSQECWDSQAIAISLSCGVAVCQTNDSETTLFERADRALYAAKRSGRNATFFDCGDQAVRYSPPFLSSVERTENYPDHWGDEASIAWQEDPEAQALIDVLRQKLSDLRIFE
jgi:diguanylate cyclase